MTKTLGITLLVLTSSLLLSAQNISFSYGEIGDFEKEYQTVPYDTGASAVVFFKTTEINYKTTNDNGYHQLITKKYRAKILKPEGIYYSDRFKFRYHEDDEFAELKFRTANYEDNNWVIHEHEDSDFKEIKLNDTRREKVIALKNVKEGTIIEYSVTYHSKSHYYIDDFYFQEEAPVLHAGINAQIPSFYYFRTFFQNCDTVDVATTNEYKQYLDLRYLGAIDLAGNITTVKGLHYNFIKKNVEAYTPYRFVTSNDDYRQKVIFQLTATHYPSREIEHIMTTWDDLNTKIRENDFIFEKLKSNRFLKKNLETLALDSLSQIEKIERIYNFTKKNIQWKGTYRVNSTKEFKDFLTNNEFGSTGDINLTLMGLLNNAGIKAYPVFVSTRWNGKPYKEYPTFDLFNTVIAYVETESGPMLLDAHDKDIPKHVLPAENLNYEGYLVTSDTAYWIPIKDHVADLTQGMVKYKFSTDLSILEAESQFAFYGQAAVDWNAPIAEKSLEFYKNKIAGLPQKPTVEVTNANTNKLNPLELEAQFYLEVQKGGDFLYLNPNLFELVDASLLNIRGRKTPIEFNYPENFNLLYQIEIPEGYKLTELPTPLRISLPNNQGLFFFTCAQNGNLISLSYRLNRQQDIFLPDAFEALQQFISVVNEKQNLSLILKKI
ncbi:MAG: DUF3857 domain-containing protein [Salinivirgaceae bacterium]